MARQRRATGQRRSGDDGEDLNRNRVPPAHVKSRPLLTDSEGFREHRQPDEGRRGTPVGATVVRCSSINSASARFVSMA
jgi:hypothetical protein